VHAPQAKAKVPGRHFKGALASAGALFGVVLSGLSGQTWRRKEPWPQKPFSLRCCLGSNRDFGSGVLFPPTPRGRRGGQRASNRPITFKWIGVTRQESSAREWCRWAAHPLQRVQRIISTNTPMLSAIELGCDQPTQFDRIVPGRSLRRAPFSQRKAPRGVGPGLPHSSAHRFTNRMRFAAV